MKRKFLWISGLIVLIVLFAFMWWRYYFVFGEGVKAGTLNFVVKKGYVFRKVLIRPTPEPCKAMNLSSVLPTTALQLFWSEVVVNLWSSDIRSFCIHCHGVE